MLKKIINTIVVLSFMFIQPITVFANMDLWQVYENPSAGGIGFLEVPSDLIPKKKEVYLLRGSQGALWVAKDAIWLTLYEEQPVIKKGNHQALTALGGVNIKISFPGASSKGKLEVEQRMPGSVSILKGKDPAAWITTIPVWGLLRYHNLFPGVDLVIHY